MTPLREGSKVPRVTFRARAGAEWRPLTSDEVFAGKTVVVFSLPGAFAPTCSSTHLPRYNELAPAFFANGVDTIACLSVNDAFVMNEWAAGHSGRSRVVGAIAGRGTVPQVFVNGRRIGGLDELRNWAKQAA